MASHLCPWWFGYLLVNPLRRLRQDPRRLLGPFVRDGMVVLEPGCGMGFFTLEAARMVGPDGRVVAVDVQPRMLAGLERRAARGQPLEPIVSVASFFVSRVDSKVDAAIEQRLAALPAGSAERSELEQSRGQAAVANARLAYQRFREVFGSPRFIRLREQGARVQRPLWASTSTKNPAYPDTLYVDELIGPDTVNTLPPQTLAAYDDHGRLETTITRDLDAAHALFRRLPELGVPIHDLIGQLEEEGVKAFAKSFDSLLATLEEKRARMAGKPG